MRGSWSAFLFIALLLAAPAGAQQTPTTQVSEMPRFLFVVERNASMDRRWGDNPAQPSRWDVVVDAIIGAVNSAPAGSRFALLTTDHHADGWYAVSSFEHPDLHLARSMIAAPLKLTSSRDIGSALDGAIRDYLAQGLTGHGDLWNVAPFAEPCTSIEVIVIGDGIGDAGDERPEDAQFSGDVSAWTCQHHVHSETGYTLLDDAAWYGANHDLSSEHAGAQTVRVHTILLDALQTDSLADELFASAAAVSGGLYTRADDPADVSLGISLAMSDAYQSVLNVSTAATSVVGHRMFRTWTEIPAPSDDAPGAPLYRGHVEAFGVSNRPSEAAFGAIREPALWDAAELLSRRRATSAERNSYVYGGQDPAQHTRTLFTNDPTETLVVPRRLVPFDVTRAHVLGALMLGAYGTYQWGTHGCPDFHPDDLDRNCMVDVADAVMAIDFLRGVPDATFLGTGTPRTRGDWRMGGMFLSTPAFSDTRSKVFTNDVPMVAYQQRLAEHESVLFVPSNDGFLHAFSVPFLDVDDDGWEDLTTDAAGGWELWAYIPRHLLAHDSPYHDDLHSALNLMRDGESFLNDGSVNLADIWMDGIPNRLDDECVHADADGAIDADGCEFHRVLIASMGMGSRYHYALDVTHPRQPRFLWEWVGDRDGWRKGLSTGTPIITSVYDAMSNTDVPVVIWSGGTSDVDDNVPERPRWPVPSERQGNVPGVGARWYMVDLMDPRNEIFSQEGYRVDTSLSTYIRGTTDPRYVTSDAAAGLFGTPAAVDYDSDGNVDALYIGTRHGELIKVLIDHGALSATTMESPGASGGSTCVLRGPQEFPDPQDATDNQALYHRPSVTRDRSGRIRVTWGTGWPGNLAEPYETGYLFSVTDGEFAGDEWTCQPAVQSTCGALMNPMQLDPGEKLVGEVLTHAGKLMFTTYVADNVEGGPACGVGHARVYALDLDDCLGGFVEGRDWGPSTFDVTDARFVEIAGIPSKMSFSNNGIYLSVTGPDGAMEAIGPIRPERPGADMDRVAFANWRTVL